MGIEEATCLASWIITIVVITVELINRKINND